MTNSAEVWPFILADIAAFDPDLSYRLSDIIPIGLRGDTFHVVEPDELPVFHNDDERALVNAIISRRLGADIGLGYSIVRYDLPRKGTYLIRFTES